MKKIKESLETAFWILLPIVVIIVLFMLKMYFRKLELDIINYLFN